MKFRNVSLVLLAAIAFDGYTANAFSTGYLKNRLSIQPLAVSIGLGPDEAAQKKTEEVAEEGGSGETDDEERELIPGVDYEIPDHESLRKSRRSKNDERCDAWFGALLGEEFGMLGDLATQAKEKLLTPVELKNEIGLPEDDPEYTPYVNTKLPWEPLYPAFGLEEYGLPIPRRNAEAWRHFDVFGMVKQDYSASPQGVGTNWDIAEDKVAEYKQKLIQNGGWLEDDQVDARLVYVNGRFCPQLSKTTNDARTMTSNDLEDPEIQKALARLTDGFTDTLAAEVPSGPTDFLTSFQELSGPNHCVGDPTSQFAINSQQGTACFAALNTIRTGSVAYVRTLAGEGEEEEPQKVLLVNALTKDLGADPSLETDIGAACHPRALVFAEDNSHLSFVQSCVDLDEGIDRPTLYNGFTQIFVKEGASVKHSYLEESGGMVIGATEISNNEVPEGERHPKDIEAERPALKNTHLEVIDAHVVGEGGEYTNTMMSVGGSGRIRMALSVSLLKPSTHAEVRGFSLTGGAQRTDIKTNIHHIAQGCTSEQLQKCMIGGRGTGSFRGRIRVEQSAQQTDSDQLSRTILLSDRCRAWAAPTLEIIADDVKCAHGATVSDLSDEELFYLRSRGLDTAIARKLLMYAFAGDISSCVDPAMLGEVDSKKGLQSRVIERLENLVPKGDRAVKGEFQSI